MQNPISNTFDQAVAFQRLWTDSMTKMTGVLTQFSPASPPIEEARKLRAGLLGVLGEACEEFMRSPQFMDTMKASLNGMLDMRRFSRKGMDAIHEQFDTPDKEDIDGILLAIRHVERRVLDRIEDLDTRLAAIEAAGNGSEAPSAPPLKRTSASPQRRTAVAKPPRRRRPAATEKRSKAGKRS